MEIGCLGTQIIFIPLTSIKILTQFLHQDLNFLKKELKMKGILIFTLLMLVAAMLGIGIGRLLEHNSAPLPAAKAGTQSNENPEDKIFRVLEKRNNRVR